LTQTSLKHVTAQHNTNISTSLPRDIVLMPQKEGPWMVFMPTHCLPSPVPCVHDSFSGPTELHLSTTGQGITSRGQFMILTAIRTSDLTSLQKLTIFVAHILNL